MRNYLIFLIMALAGVSSALAQARDVKGVVLSQDEGEPLIGVSVKVKGAKGGVGTATDIDGRFTLKNVPESAKQLEFTYIGYKPVAASIQPDMTVYMSIESEALDELIVVAFGKQKREAFTGSASVVSSETIERQQVTNPIEALQGNVTGFQMLESNSPTEDGSITIRGIGSLNASTEPLIVVDGLPYNGLLNDINPADVASMTVLKDAASNALYGARGANGVILVTTKTAKRGKTRVNAEARWGANTDGLIRYNTINEPGQYYEAQYMALNNYLLNSQGLSSYNAFVQANQLLSQPVGVGGLGYMVYSVPDGQPVIGSNGRLNPNARLGNRVENNGVIYTLYPDNWLKEGMRTGFRQEYNLNINGGSDQFLFMASLGYLKSQGLAYGSDIERLSARLKADYQAYSWLRVGANSSYTYTYSNTSDGVYGTVYSMAPIYPAYLRDANGDIMHDEHGKMYDYGAGTVGCERPVDTNGNVLQSDLLDKYTRSGNAFNLQGYADIDFLNHFKLTVNGSVYLTEARRGTAYNPYYGYQLTTGGYVYTGQHRTYDLNFQQLLDYNQVFGPHSVDVLIGHEYNRDQTGRVTGGRNNIALYEYNTELDGAIVNADMGGYVTKYNVEGYFIRGQYDYDNKIFGSFSFRRDGSSRFHPKHRWGNFWSVGAAYILSKEEWWPQNGVVNMLKYKISYGEQGNDGIGSYRYVDQYSIRNQDGEVAFVFSSKGNENITWETVGSFNTGVEFEMFNARLSGGLEFYVRNTRDMLMYFTVPYSMGYGGYYDNIGDMRNTGLELTLSGSPVMTRNFQWTLGANLTWEHNRVTRLPDQRKGTTVDGYKGFANGYTFIAEGRPVNEWYLTQYAGVSDNGEALYWATGSDGERYKTTRFDECEYHLCGSALPDVFGGFNTSFKLYGFDLNAQFNYSIGGVKMDNQYRSMMTPPVTGVGGYVFHQDIFDSWSASNPNSDIPRWQYGDQYTSVASDRFLTNASSLTFKSVTLGYTLPQEITRKAMMEKVRFYVAADNIYYWSKRKGFDPRMGELYGNYNDASGYNFPTRTISGGVQLQF